MEHSNGNPNPKGAKPGNPHLNGSKPDGAASLLKTKQKVPNYLNSQSSQAKERENSHLSKDKQDNSHNSHKNETIIKESPVI